MFQQIGFRNSVIVMIALGLASSQSLAQVLYWCEGSSNRVSRSNLDGTSVDVIVSTGLSTPDGMALDHAAGKVYWAEQGGSIKRANLNGTGVELIISAGGVPDSVALDLLAGRVCWTESTAGRIRCADLAGGNVETVISTNASSAHGLAIDSAAGKIYWTQLSGSIRRANMNGTSNELIVGSAIGPHGLALDLVHGKLYWTDLTANRIQRSNLNGSNVETLVTVGNGPAALALDLVGGKMYWTDLADGRICVANLDGTNVQLLVAGLNLPLGLALDLPPVGLPALSTWGLILSSLLIASAAWYRLRRDGRSYA